MELVNELYAFGETIQGGTPRPQALTAMREAVEALLS